jgi:hypothetical protein
MVRALDDASPYIRKRKYRSPTKLKGRFIRMRFLSVYQAPERTTAPTEEEKIVMGRFIEQGMKSGVLLATEGCMPTAHGARVRLSGGKLTTTDGPFAEAKEVIAGFALLQAASKEEALAYVREFLNVVGGGVCELRQLYG